MTTYESDLAARFAALAPQPLPGSWDDVVGRAGMAGARRRGIPRSSRRRRLYVVVAAVALVAAVTTAAFAIVRVIVDRGFVGLPPVGASPSAPEGGTLVLSFSGRSTTLDLRMTGVFVYADGRVVWVREGGAPEGANTFTSGLLEQRLTRQGVELLRSKVVASGLFRDDVDLITGSAEHLQPWQVELFRGTIETWNGERLVRVRWMNRAHLREHLSDFPGTYTGETATPEQERALERLDALLVDPAASLPASAWQDRRVKAYVPSKLAVCLSHRPEQGPDRPTPPTLGPSSLLALLPADAAEVLRAASSPRPGCAVVATDDAREVAGALDAAGLEKRSGGEGPGSYNEFGLGYRFKAPDERPGYVYVTFEPTLPHGEWLCIACG